MKIEFRIWLTDEKKENKIFGEGPKRLLMEIEEYGSLRQAAASMNMSYSKAWGVISKIEKHLNIKLLEKQIGGAKGGGSTLTPTAKDLLERYQKMEQEVETSISDIQQKFFDDFLY
ncbi:LysR family transcriptional regulator [Irregularibacter muris]|uniref:LysR family transcriptional regulator n=1 Tax=Irregularibacter muris TaxID=1796619 RepID=A0AAE3HFA4_9FIRM|nr:LysR family transcriptional regulator [Irregularibacter muris]MCR1898078.1 LysR family transcriptional regulator [Irregularibacter muris]